MAANFLAESPHARFTVNNFDLIRIFAATQVLVLHTIDRLAIAKPFYADPLAMFPGVPIFFVVSGFLVSASLDRSPNVRTYFRNRFLRIFPGLWVCLLATVAVAALFGFNPLSLSGLTWLAAQTVGLIYTPDFLSGFGMGSYNGSLWTIPVELQFYFVLPALYLVFGQRKLRGAAIAFAGFAAVAIAIKILFPGLGLPTETGIEKLIRYSFLPHVYLFFFGAWLQLSGAWKTRAMAGKGVYWLAFYLAFRLLMPGFPGGGIAGMVLMGVAVISLAYTGDSHDILKGRDISYGVYIYHGLVLNILIELGLTGRHELVLVVLASAYVLGAMSWFLIEKPSLRKKAKADVAIFPDGPATPPLVEQNP
jgi:peptidoglycan/LPS O-acetylase OafA/YrhL